MTYLHESYLKKAKTTQLSIVESYVAVYKKLFEQRTAETALNYQQQVARRLVDELAASRMQLLREMSTLNVCIQQSFRDDLLRQERLLNLLFVMLLRDEQTED